MIAPLELRQLPRFPCQTENKKPLTPHGFKDAVRVRDDSGWPLVGVPTGVKFDALDIDPRNGGASWFDANFDALPLTRCHQTQSGGIHLLFLPAVGLRCTSGRIAPGVDVRAKGGYVIWWPREGLPFEDHPLCGWPDWLLAEAMKPKPRLAGIGEPITSAPPHHASDLTAALRKLDPLRWGGQFEEWFVLMAACRAVGIGREDFIEWSIGDPRYAGDAGVIGRMWEGLAPKHGGALWAALAQAGIKVANHARAGRRNGHPLTAAPAHTPTRNLKSRLISLQRTVERAEGTAKARADTLFWAACRCAEIISEGKLKPSMAMALLISAAKVNGLWREIGKSEVCRTISNGLRHVELKMLEESK
jgi:Bifunctional DNA primase/polymerase, N-terminal